MTKRKDPSELKIKARDDLSIEPRKKRGNSATPEQKAKRIAALRAKSPDTSSPAALALANPNRPLTEKQQLFIKNWASGETVATAAYRAGYSDAGTMAYKMAKDPAILKIYHREKALYEESCQMTRKRVMEGFLEAAEMAKIQADPTALTGAWREVGKMCGYYLEQTKKVEISVTGDITMKRLEKLDDAALLRLIKGEVEEVAYEMVAEAEAEND